MRLAEVMGCRVVDADGRDIGAVHDVRLVADGSADAGERRSYRLDALVVGTGGAAHRLGYSHDDMTGPWPLTAVLRRIAQRSKLVAWRDVSELGRPTIRIRTRVGELPSLADSDDLRAQHD